MPTIIVKFHGYATCAKLTSSGCFCFQAVKKAKQFEVRKLCRKSHQSADPSPVDVTRNKKVVDLQKIEAQLTAMRV